MTCVVPESRLFCNLSPAGLSDLDSLRRTSSYPENALLYVEGGQPNALFILCAGKAKLAATAKDGKTVTLREILPGQVMGLSCVVSGRPYQTSAQTLVPSEVSMVPAAHFIEFLRRNNEVALRVAEQLSMELHSAWAQTRMLALAPSARAKLAQLLVFWADRDGQTTTDGVRFSMNITQEAVGEAIGATRETVSRLLSEFQRKRLVRVTGSSVLLLQLDELRGIGAA